MGEGFIGNKAKATPACFLRIKPFSVIACLLQQAYLSFNRMGSDLIQMHYDAERLIKLPPIWFLFWSYTRETPACQRLAKKQCA